MARKGMCPDNAGFQGFQAIGMHMHGSVAMYIIPLCNSLRLTIGVDSLVVAAFQGHEAADQPLAHARAPLRAMSLP
jgi:hypothetical protein